MLIAQINKREFLKALNGVVSENTQFDRTIILSFFPSFLNYGEIRINDAIVEGIVEIKRNYIFYYKQLKMVVESIDNFSINIEERDGDVFIDGTMVHIHSKREEPFVIDDDLLFTILDECSSVFLYEPYRSRKHIPLGLGKIATYLKKKNKKAIFSREYIEGNYDLLCIESIFTYNAARVFDFIDSFMSKHPYSLILLGGTFPTLMSKFITEKYPRIIIFKGYSKRLDLYNPDYSIDWGINDLWKGYSQFFISRGCPNSCPYCAVSRLENMPWINKMWKNQIVPENDGVILLDNNITAFPLELFSEFCDYILEKKIRSVELNSGFDCKYVSKDLVDLVCKLPIIKRGIRLAFDRMEDDGIFQKAVQMFLDVGISKYSIQAYVLFNFTDTVSQAEYRASECRKLGIRVYPQMFVPLNHLSRRDPYVGKYWTLNLARAWNFFYSHELYLQMSFEEYMRGRAKKYTFSQADFDAWYF